MSQDPASSRAEPPPWEDIPCSARALSSRRSPQAPVSTRPAAALLPWWLNPLCLFAMACVLMYRRAVPHAWKRRCIYRPTCSMYGLQALRMDGFWRGAWRTWARIQRCNDTLFQGGVDAP
ncbi:membrane protein insertion efficiency factor YidD [Corallococcus sp. H22C18031201]|nr:membrane protein insertion efficiency factor YidD [Corallococcus sp. H22C18031201]